MTQKTYIPVEVDSLPKGALSMRQVAADTGVPYPFIRNAAVSGKIPSIAYGKKGRGVGRYLDKGSVAELLKLIAS